MITDRAITSKLREHGKPMPTPANPGTPLETKFLNAEGNVVAFHLHYPDGSMFKFGKTELSDWIRRDAPPVPDAPPAPASDYDPALAYEAWRQIQIEEGHLDAGTYKPEGDSVIHATTLMVNYGDRTKEAPEAWSNTVASTISPIIPLPPAPRYTDVMIDMEGLNDTPDSAPAEIALVFFDRDEAAKEFCKYRYEPSPISAIRLGFTVGADTLKWWDDQGMKIDVQHGEPLADVLDEIALDIARHGAKGIRVWSRGNTYDLAILKLAYHRTGKTLPWDFWNERDVRTWLEGSRFKSPRKNDHDALQDACNQALDIIEATAPILITLAL